MNRLLVNSIYSKSKIKLLKNSKTIVLKIRKINLRQLLKLIALVRNLEIIRIVIAILFKMQLIIL